MIIEIELGLQWFYTKNNKPLSIAQKYTVYNGVNYISCVHYYLTPDNPA